jgi:Zn-dependent protease with chaperone function
MPTYPGISSEAFRHPLDKQAEEALRSFPGFDLVARSFVEYVYERPQNVFLMGNCIQAGVRQYSTLHGIFRESVRDLDIYPQPGIFVSQNPAVNSYALGHERPVVVVTTGLLDLMSETELRTVIAHELGHIKCDHSVLIQMAIWAMGAASMLGDLTLGVGKIISSGLLYAFYEWRRKAELSADRAALLVMGELLPVMQTLMRMAGGSNKYSHEINLNEFIEQSEQYQKLDDDNLNPIYKFLLYNGGNGTFLSHPFAVERLHYLREWSTSPEYAAIREGNYTHEDATGAINVRPTPQGKRSEVENLRKQVEELQREIDRINRQRNQP